MEIGKGRQHARLENIEPVIFLVGDPRAWRIEDRRLAHDLRARALEPVIEPLEVRIAWPEVAFIANDWRHSESWPPPGTVQQKFYLTGDGRLSADGPDGEARRYRYDPNRPIPTLGGRNMLIESGPRDQRPVQALPNYGLSYRSEVLDHDITIAGSVDVTLHIQSNCRDTDFVAKLVELQADSSAMLLMDGVVRAMYRDAAARPQPLAPDQVYPLTIHLGDIHHTFIAGSRLQVDITSSNFPRRVRNTNSGNAILANDTAADIHIASNAVHHRAGQPSFLVLPVLPVSPRKLG